MRLLLISPFFVMPTVNALLWKHMMMNPIYGVLAQVWIFFGAQPVDWLTEVPLGSAPRSLSARYPWGRNPKVCSNRSA